MLGVRLTNVNPGAAHRAAFGARFTGTRAIATVLSPMRTPRSLTTARARPGSRTRARPHTPASTRVRSRTLQPATAAQFEAHAGEAAALLKVLANPHRLGVLCQLVGGELSVGELLARFELSQSALSQHLAVLRTQGLVATRRDAQVIHYRLADGPAHEIIETLHRIYCRPASRRPRAATGRMR